MTHPPMLSAKQNWRKPDRQNRLPEIIEGIEFRAGAKPETKAAGSDRPQLSGTAPNLRCSHVRSRTEHWRRPEIEEHKLAAVPGDTVLAACYFPQNSSRSRDLRHVERQTGTG